MTDSSVVLSVEGELELKSGEVTAAPQPLAGESLSSYSARLKDIDQKSLAGVCKSENHPRSACWGEVDDCPVCETPHCYADGVADAVSEAEGFGNICDTCAVEVILGNPEVVP